MGTALISTWWSIRKRSSPGSTNAGSVVVKVVADCGFGAAARGPGAFASAPLAPGGGQTTGAPNRPSMLAPWL